MTNEKCSLKKTEFIKRESTDTFKFLLEVIKWNRILPNNFPNKAYETFHCIFFLTCMILHSQKEKLKLKLNTYSLPG